MLLSAMSHEVRRLGKRGHPEPATEGVTLHLGILRQGRNGLVPLCGRDAPHSRLRPRPVTPRRQERDAALFRRQAGEGGRPTIRLLWASQHQLLLPEREICIDIADAHSVELMRPMRCCHAPLEGGTALQDSLLGAPRRRGHADVGHRADEVLAMQQAPVLFQGQGVAMDGATVPEQQVAGLGAYHHRLGRALREHHVVGIDAKEVPTIRPFPVIPEDVAMEAVRAGHHYETASASGCVLEGEEPLNAMEPTLPVSLVDVVPIHLGRSPGSVVPVGPEDPRSVEGCHQVLGAPDVGEGLLQGRQPAQVPECLGLTNASRVDDPVLLACRPTQEVLLAFFRGMRPSTDIRPVDHAARV
mmetsp:Transcript_65977/g.141192  ORF Transcript_65977/g.141192 Transcript_65977/m.141192 type:complete len:357 (-) Transcript_65977:355-1425(-)